MAKHLNAYSIYRRAFDAQRSPRSEAYKLGVLAALQYRCGTARSVCCQYEPGSAELDAWSAGVGEGHALYRDALTELGAGEVGQ